MFSSKLNIIDIVNYVGGDKKRPIIEGEALIDAGHVILCGIKEKKTSFIRVAALCLQTSNLKGKPHEIGIKLSTRSGDEVEIEATCTCKAGNSSQCKHIVGTLIYLNR